MGFALKLCPNLLLTLMNVIDQVGLDVALDITTDMTEKYAPFPHAVLTIATLVPSTPNPCVCVCVRACVRACVCLYNCGLRMFVCVCG